MGFEKTNYAVLFRAYGYLTLAAFLITIFLASIIQGVMVQVGGNFFLAVGLYLLSWVCLGTGALFFFKGKKLVHYVLLSS